MTAVPIVIRFRPEDESPHRTREGNWKDILISSLKQYVTEELNPENQKGVQGLEVFVSSPLLSSGMGIVDTPGLGPVFTGNTPATQAFIPHIDAALVVVGADPPLAGEELTGRLGARHHSIIGVLACQRPFSFLSAGAVIFVFDSTGHAIAEPNPSQPR